MRHHREFTRVGQSARPEVYKNPLNIPIPGLPPIYPAIIIPFIFPSIVFTFLETIVSNGFHFIEYKSVAPIKCRRAMVSNDVVIGHSTTDGTVDIDSFNARDYA